MMLKWFPIFSSLSFTSFSFSISFFLAFLLPFVLLPFLVDMLLKNAFIINMLVETKNEGSVLLNH